MRSDIAIRRTYNRPLGNRHETWAETCARATAHSRSLWTGIPDDGELATLESNMVAKRSLLAGRTMWLGGTEIARTRAASQFNCSFLRVATVHDLVDALWLLLQGCGVGFQPVPGNLYGYRRPMAMVVRDDTHPERGEPGNRETVHDGVWTLRFGDSAEAWAKAWGKLVANKPAAHTLVLDFTNIRKAGGVLRGYGWTCSGSENLRTAIAIFHRIMNEHAGKMLPFAAIHDIINLMGTVLSSRRSAQIALRPMDIGWREFAGFKADQSAWWRGQSNNSVMMDHWNPDVFDAMVEAGGSEPGIVNIAAARRRAPWFAGTNPCGEILLPSHGFCNLATINQSVQKAPNIELTRLMARANYRQTNVDLRDGVLQTVWHETNAMLRLCGVSGTGWTQADWVTPEALRALRAAAWDGMRSMADEMGMPHAAAVTTIKPEGTASKVMGCAEGIHRPVGRYVLNRVVFPKGPLAARAEAHGYEVAPHPHDPSACLVTLPVEFPGAELVDTEPAVSQLNRYKMFMDNYVDHNASVTIRYRPEEVPAVKCWMKANWDVVVGVAFIPYQDPSRSARDLGYQYLPQQVVTEAQFRRHKGTPFDLDETEMQPEAECVGGMCPVR